VGSLGSAAFQEEANRRVGEGLAVEVRMRDSANNLVVLTDEENLVSISPLVRKREREFGVVEGATVTVRFAHKDLTFNPSSPAWVDPTDRSLVFKWADIRIGFPELDEWIPVANGRIGRSFVDADGSATLTIRDVTMDILRQRLSRDKAWTSTGWVSEIQPVQVTTSAASVTQNQVLTGGNESWLGDFTYEIQFTGAATFDIIHVDEPTYNQTGLSTGSLQQIMRAGVIPIVDLPTSVWSGTYIAGDTFRLYTSKKYSTSALNPVTVLLELLVLGGTVKSVATGLSLPIYADGPITQWSTLQSRFAGFVVEGAFAKDTSLMELVQGILVGLQASIFPTGTGQIGVFHFHPDDSGAAAANVTGDPNDPNVSILQATRTEDSSDRANRVAFSYQRFGGSSVGKGANRGSEDAGFEAVDSNDPIGFDVPHTMSSPWEWSPGVIDAATNQVLLRVSTPLPKYHVKGTLRELLAHELSEPILVTEPGLSETQRKIQVVQVAVSPLANHVEILGFSDPTVDSLFARINRTEVGDPDVIF